MPIARTAIVHPHAQIDPSTTVGDYCVVEDGVVIGANCRLDPFSIIKRYTTMGEGNHVFAGAQLGTDPLDKKFHEENPSYLRIGDHNVFREYLTVSRGTEPESTTIVGDHNYVMTNVHIAHNAVIGNHNTLVCNVLIGGHVTMEDNCFLSGGVVVHQHSKLGSLCMVGGNTRVIMDVPPYFLVAEHQVAAHGLNIVGLRRAGFKRDSVLALKKAYRLLYREGLSRAEALTEIEALGTPETTHLVAFVRASHRGICPDASKVSKAAARPADASSNAGESTATDPDSGGQSSQ